MQVEKHPMPAITTSRCFLCCIVFFMTMVIAPMLRAQEPFILFPEAQAARSNFASDTLYWYEGAPLQLPVVAVPEGMNLKVPDGATIVSIEGKCNDYLMTVSHPPLGTSMLRVSAT